MLARLSLLLALLTACDDRSTPASGRPVDPGSSAGTDGASGSTGHLVGGAGGSGAAGAPVDCVGVGGEIYAVTEDGVLLSFEPRSGQLAERGQLACPGPASGAYSMAVDRTGHALVLLQDGRLMRVDLADASCQAASYEPLQQGWQVFGMGYAATAGPAKETLFVADATRTALQQPGIERGLGRLGTTLRLTTVGAFDGGLTGRLAELTGRGDGRLFAFFVQEPSLAEIDPGTARVRSNTPLDVPVPTAWAFAHWGGAFYLFVAPGTSSSRLYRHRPAGSTTTLLLDTGRRVVGAGVSTCAPLDDGAVVE